MEYRKYLHSTICLCKRVPHKIVFWLSITIGSTLLLGLLITPSIIRYYLISNYEARGADQVNIEDVDFNPFTGHIVITNIEFISNKTIEFSAKKIEANLSWTELLKSNILIQELKTKQISINFRKLKKGWLIAGIKDWSRKKGRKPWYLKKIKIDKAVLDTTNLTLIDGKSHNIIKLGAFSLSGLNTSATNKTSHVHLNGLLNGALVDLKILIKPFEVKPKIEVIAKIGNASLANISSWFSKKYRLHSGTLDLEAKTQVILEPNLVISGTIDSKFVIKNASHKSKVLSFNSGIIKINNKGTFNIKPGKHGLKYKSLANISLTNASLKTLIKSNSLALKNIKSQTKLDLALNNGVFSPTLKSSFKIGSLKTENHKNDIDLIEIFNLRSKSLKYNLSKGLTITKLETGKINLIQNISNPKNILQQFRHRKISIKQVSLKKVKIDKTKGLKIQQINLSTLNADLVRNTQGWPKPSLPTQCLNLAREEIPKFAIRRIRCINSCKINLVDNNLSPAYTSTIKFKRLLISNINSNKAHNRTYVKSNGLLGKFGKFDLNGYAKLSHPKVNMSFSLNMNEIALRKYSRYFSAFYGLGITSGQMFYAAKINIRNNKLKLNNKLEFTRLRIKKEKSPNPNPYVKKLKFSASLISGLARFSNDRNNRLKYKPFNVPLDLCNPNSSLSSVIGTILFTIIKRSGSLIIRYINPVGQTITAGQKLIKFFRQIKLKNIFFKAGSNRFDRRAKRTIKKLAKFLRKKTKYTIKFCAKYTDEDINYFYANSGLSRSEAVIKANNLAQDRATKIKSRLIKKYDISSNRLFICEPKLIKPLVESIDEDIDEEEDTSNETNVVKPRVDITL